MLTRRVPRQGVQICGGGLTELPLEEPHPLAQFTADGMILLPSAPFEPRTLAMLGGLREGMIVLAYNSTSTHGPGS